MQLACCIYYFMYPGITELNNFSCFKVDKVIVLSALIGSFKLRYVLSKLMLNYQITVEEEFNCIVKCCPANPVILIFHKNVQRFNIKVAGS